MRILKVCYALAASSHSQRVTTRESESNSRKPNEKSYRCHKAKLDPETILLASIIVFTYLHSASLYGRYGCKNVVACSPATEWPTHFLEHTCHKCFNKEEYGTPISFQYCYISQELVKDIMSHFDSTLVEVATTLSLSKFIQTRPFNN